MWLPSLTQSISCKIILFSPYCLLSFLALVSCNTGSCFTLHFQFCSLICSLEPKCKFEQILEGNLCLTSHIDIFFLFVSSSHAINQTACCVNSWNGQAHTCNAAAAKIHRKYAASSWKQPRIFLEVKKKIRIATATMEHQSLGSSASSAHCGLATHAASVWHQFPTFLFSSVAALLCMGSKWCDSVFKGSNLHTQADWCGLNKARWREKH